MKYKLLFFFITGMLLASCSKIEDEYVYDTGYAIDWSAAADSASSTLPERFWNEEGYFNYENDGNGTGFQYWPQAQAMDVIIDAYLRSGNTKYSDLFTPWYEGIKVKNGNSYWNNFYDDMEWIALTMVRLYETTQDEKHLNTAKELWGYIEGGWNEEYGGGGIAWKSDQRWSKNACSNGPAALLAMRLYSVTQDEVYKNWGIKIYAWLRENLFNKATGAVYDNLNGETGEIGSFSLSYNQGTFLGAAHELYKVTGEANYLKDARKAAYFCISDAGMIDSGNNVLRDEGSGDGGFFKGIFMRYFVKLIMEPDLDELYRKKFETFFNNNAEVLWRKGVNKLDILFSTNWTTPASGSTQLGAQTSGCALIEARSLWGK